MAKRAVAIKLEESKIEEIKKTAESEGKTLTDILLEGLFVSGEIRLRDARIAELEKSQRDLEAKFEAATGKKPRTKKRISIPVTDAEFEVIKKIAFERDVSKSQLLRNMLIKENVLPALEKV